MTIYDVIRRMVEARPFQPHEQAEALDLLDDMEKMNVWGTTARQLDVGGELTRTRAREGAE